MKKFIFRFFEDKRKKAVNRWRIFYYKNVFSKYGKGTTIGGPITVYSPENIEIGEHSTINNGVRIVATAPVIIGNHVHVSPGVSLLTAYLNIEETGQRSHSAKKIVIEDGAWLATNCIVNAGVKIGKNSVIGSGSVVTKDIPANCFAAGIPAVVKRQLS